MPNIFYHINYLAFNKSNTKSLFNCQSIPPPHPLSDITPTLKVRKSEALNEGCFIKTNSRNNHGYFTDPFPELPADAEQRSWPPVNQSLFRPTGNSVNPHLGIGHTSVFPLEKVFGRA